MLERTLIAALANALYYIQNDNAYQQFRSMLSQGSTIIFYQIVKMTRED